ncbi:MAG TPA: divalent metal cation transporter [Acidisoma sp.]|jgi:NRAMP (natural resistance-associated macrophage protein)-like metal ion transporter|nr:divalent metal cation transporter [Acidisoma sp.]
MSHPNPAVLEPDEVPKQPERPKLMDVMGPGLITGASDDDPSGIATYSQAGAQFGLSLGWTLVLTFPLMCAIQQISAEIGRVTGRGLAGNLRRYYPAWLLNLMVGLLIIANTINIGADLGAMAAALRLLIQGPLLLYVAGFAVLSVGMEVFLRYSRYVSVLKWLTLSLFAYVATVFVVGLPWGQALAALIVPHVALRAENLTVIVAIFGTTISPYLFFWQAGEEVEDMNERPDSASLLDDPAAGPRELSRIRMDTYLGMALSNVVALFIVWTTAATLHAHGVTNIETSEQAAEALRPIAGPFAFVVFALGIVGTGLLAVPVLAGSAAYAIGEARNWPIGLARRPGKARAFYGTIAAATLVGASMNFIGIDPVQALIWSAVVNGVVAVPIMAMMVLMACRADVMGGFAIGPWLRGFGWLATAVMALAAIGMFATWGS